jgi:cobaltochelatase CobN
VRDIGLDHDAGITKGDATDAALEKLDAYLCDLKEMQIRDGLHIFGKAPEGRLLTDLVTALARVPRGLGEGADQSLQRAIAGDRDWIFDPLDCAMGEAWAGPKPDLSGARFGRSVADRGRYGGADRAAGGAAGRGEVACPAGLGANKTVLDGIDGTAEASGGGLRAKEIDGLMAALSGRFVEPGPSGAPTRGRPDVLPTGRNFYSVDSRAVPTETAWELGRKSAELLVTRYTQDHGEWPVVSG